MPVFSSRLCFHSSLKSNKNSKNLLNVHRNALLTALPPRCCGARQHCLEPRDNHNSSTRAVGAASFAACGSGVTNLIKADNTSHIKGLPEAAATNSAYNAAECNLWLCKGLQLADNKANVQKFTAGGSGYADLDSNSAYRDGERERGRYENESGDWGPLISFTGYADQTLPTLPKNNHKFQLCDSKGVGEALRSRRTMCTFISVLTFSREQKRKGFWWISLLR